MNGCDKSELRPCIGTDKEYKKEKKLKFQNSHSKQVERLMASQPC